MLALLFLGYSCKKENPISNDPSLKLSFSTDTLLFDTVFTSLGSTTHHLMIYNKHDDDLKISSIRLLGGEDSPYRLNLDGESGTEDDGWFEFDFSDGGGLFVGDAGN